MLRNLLPVCAALIAAASPPLAQEAVCRREALGSVACLGVRVPPPPPRPLAAPEGLDVLLAPPPPGSRPPDPVPPRRTNAFGDTRLSPGEAGAGGPCRRDTLGNLHCR